MRFPQNRISIRFLTSEFGERRRRGRPSTEKRDLKKTCESGNTKSEDQDSKQTRFKKSIDSNNCLEYLMS